MTKVDEFKAAVCQNEYKAFLAGAAVTGLGFDMFLLRVSGGLLNPMVHMAAAGMGVDVWSGVVGGCRRTTSDSR